MGSGREEVDAQEASSYSPGDLGPREEASCGLGLGHHELPGDLPSYLGLGSPHTLAKPQSGGKTVWSPHMILEDSSGWQGLISPQSAAAGGTPQLPSPNAGLEQSLPGPESWAA